MSYDATNMTGTSQAQQDYLDAQRAYGEASSNSNNLAMNIALANMAAAQERYSSASNFNSGAGAPIGSFVPTTPTQPVGSSAGMPAGVGIDVTKPADDNGFYNKGNIAYPTLPGTVNTPVSTGTSMSSGGTPQVVSQTGSSNNPATYDLSSLFQSLNNSWNNKFNDFSTNLTNLYNQNKASTATTNNNASGVTQGLANLFPRYNWGNYQTGGRGKYFDKNTGNYSGLTQAQPGVI